MIKLSDVAAAIIELNANGVANNIEESLRQRFPGITREQIARAFEIARGDTDESVREGARRLIEAQSPLRQALFAAAVQADPQWEPAPPPEFFRWVGEGKSPSVDTMIDWFQMNHPAESRRIEDEVEGDT
jgi:hypothetical protein